MKYLLVCIAVSALLVAGFRVNATTHVTISGIIPTISTSLLINPLSTHYGTPSSSSRFSVSGTSLTAGILVTAPPGYEVSLNDGSGFASSFTLGSSGTIDSTSIYVRLAASTSVGSYSGNVILTSSGAATVNKPTSSGSVLTAPLTITAMDTTKNYGSLLSDFAGSTAFTVSGLQHSDSIESVSVHFALGAALPAIPSTYLGQISVNTPAGSTFSPANYSITYVPGSIRVLKAPLFILANDTTKLFGTHLDNNTASTSFSVIGLQNSDLIQSVALTFGAAAAKDSLPGNYAANVNVLNPIGASFSIADYDITYLSGGIFIDSMAAVISINGNIPALKSVYGSVPAYQHFSVQGSPLMTPVIVSAPAGYELSLIDSAGYVPVLTIPYSVILAPVPVFVRFVPGLAAGTYPGSISLSTSGTPDVYRLLTPGTVLPAPLNISADSIPKIYGTSLFARTDSIGFNVSGVVNGQKITSIWLTPDSEGFSAGTSAGSAYRIIPSAATGTAGFLTSNYAITYTAYTGSVQKMPVTITPENKTRDFGKGDPLLTAVYTGLVNGDTQAMLSKAPVLTTNETIASLPGIYSITASGAEAKNYAFHYTTGILTVLALPVLSSDDSLADLTLSSGTLSPLFLKSILVYTAMVENSISTLSILPGLNTMHASVRINGMPVSSGASIPATLLVGDNKVSIEVTAQDGITRQTYTLTVHRGVAPDAVSATNLLSPNGDGKNDTWVVKDILLYPENTVTVFDQTGRVVYTRKGYKNEWDASYRNAVLMNGTYFYVIDLGVGTPAVKGFITLLRN